jgi:hypothetical protein
MAVARHKALSISLALIPVFGYCFSLYNCYKALRWCLLNK